MQMDEQRIKIEREEAETTKAIAVEKYKEGDLVGAKEYAAEAKRLYPTLTGILCLNAVLDILIGFEKKINGEVDWYAVLGVDPTADTKTIQKRRNELFIDIVTDSDDSVGSTDKAKKILYDSWVYFLTETNRQLYDKKHKADYERHRQILERGSHVPMVLPAPRPAQRLFDPPHLFSEENGSTFFDPNIRVKVEKMDLPPLQVPGYFDQFKNSDYIPSFDNYTSVDLSAPRPAQGLFDIPQRFSQENGENIEVKVEQMVQSPLPAFGHFTQLWNATQVPIFTYSTTVFSAPTPSESFFDPPQCSSKGNGQNIEVKVEKMDEPPLQFPGPLDELRSATHQVPSFSVEVNVDQMVPPPDHIRRENQVPILTYTPVVLSKARPAQRHFDKPEIINEDNERIVEVNVEEMVQPPLYVPCPTQRHFDRTKIFNEENEEIVEVKVEYIPMRIRVSGREMKRKESPSTNEQCDSAQRSRGGRRLKPTQKIKEKEWTMFIAKLGKRGKRDSHDVHGPH
ncbi:unnamed protein product [Cochlearia groenlandica]